MPLWQGKSRGTPLGYRIFVATLKHLGLTPAYALLHLVAFYYLVFSFKSSRISYRFFRDRMHYSPGKAVTHVYKNYVRFGESIIDKIAVLSGIPTRLSFNFDDEYLLHEMISRGRGGLLLSAHIGNWEVAGNLLRRLKTKINIVLFDGEDEAIRKYITGVTGDWQVGVIVLKEDLSHIYAISEALRNNELICMHADRFLEGNKTISTDFLGSKARFPIGPFVLAQTFKVPVTFVFAMKQTKFHYYLYGSQLLDDYSKEKTKGMQLMVDKFAADMEEKVKLYPDQWYNFYNFWQA
ncbi:lipid A biosynthesis acyltransferase [Pollutibacter soli]|uniref:LpxL/LpxP family acyltransferase n=1 Tax=Pollutibacter soli TaxID=3034157 RepID=UPI003013ECD2